MARTLDILIRMFPQLFNIEGGVLSATPVVRYPGGKQRMLSFLSGFLPIRSEISGTYVEPFVGGAAVYLFVKPRRAILADLNPDLIDLYRGLRLDARAVWKTYQSFGAEKHHYHEVRSMSPRGLSLTEKSARLLYLNRTCFKGNWRQNAKGEFNIGYGGQSRRWVIGEEFLASVSRAFRRARLSCSDFEPIIDACGKGDYLFLDPPYKPATLELDNDHYIGRRFTFADQQRLARALRRATGRGVPWMMTNTDHSEVLNLYAGHKVHSMKTSSGRPAVGQAIVLSTRG